MYQHTLAPRHDINCCNVTSDRSTIQEHGQEDLGEERGEGGGGGGVRTELNACQATSKQ